MKRPKRKKKQQYRFGNVPTYETRNLKEKRETDEWAWLTAPDPAARVYDSTLSKPGRLCRCCRSFVAGGKERCGWCGAGPAG